MTVVLSISSRVVRGHVGNSAAAFALQRLGNEVWEVPTLVWNHHPGHGPPRGIRLSADDLGALLARFAEPPWAHEIGLVLTGYMAGSDQVAAVAAFLGALRRQGCTPIVGVDPICGDAAGPYVPADVIEAFRRLLVPLASFIAPNRYELGFITGRTLSSNDEIIAAARVLGPAMALVTSAFAAEGAIGNLLVTPTQAYVVELPLLAGAPNGTGDLMTALFAARLLAGEPPVQSMARAASSVHGVLGATLGLGRDRLALPEAQASLVEPSLQLAPIRLC